MFKLAMAFIAGYYFGRNPAAQRQVVNAGQQLLNQAMPQGTNLPYQTQTQINDFPDPSSAFTDPWMH